MNFASLSFFLVNKIFSNFLDLNLMEGKVIGLFFSSLIGDGLLHSIPKGFVIKRQC